VKTVSILIETQKPLVKDEEAADVDVDLYRFMIGSLLYLIASRPDIMFAVYACSRFQSDASAGFDQIVDFLNSQVIQCAFMVNPTIYVSCIKQFWVPVSIKKVKDVVKLQALIDRKKVVVTEDIICQDLRLDDADGVECLPTEEIFAELAATREEEDEDDEVPVIPTPPSPTHEPSPPPNEPITSPPQAQPAPPSSPPQD
nr:hypothetical protein [Tanacetum cinerariifolium]